MCREIDWRRVIRPFDRADVLFTQASVNFQGRYGETIILDEG